MAIKGLNGQEIDPAAMNPTTMDTLPPDAFAGATAPDLAAMPADAMGGMDAPIMEMMPANAMGGMSADMMAAMPSMAMEGMDAGMVEMMPSGVAPPPGPEGMAPPPEVEVMGGMNALDAAFDAPAGADPIGSDMESDPMAGLDAELGGAMDQATDQGAGSGAPDMGVPPDAATEVPMMDDPGSEAQEPDMPPPDDPIV